MIGVGSPTYFYRPPFVVMDFVNKLGGIQNKSTFVFISYGTHMGDCGNWIRRKLKSKGSKDLGYFTSHGKDYWMGYLKRGVLFSPDSPTEKELSAAEDFGKELTVRYSDSKPLVESFDSPTPAMYGFERMLLARPFAKLMYSKTFRADKKCDACGICIEKCPINNISANNNGQPRWHSNCLLCATCELTCPKDAVHSAFDWIIFAPFMNYNIKKSKKKQVPLARVKHTAGETHLV
jgi:ferredoxin